MISSTTSFAKTPRPNSPLTEIRRTLSGSIASDCDASTSRTWEVPTPSATAPKAPWVDVWLSPQAIVIPGWVNPSSGPMTCTIPCRSLLRFQSGIPNSAQFRSNAESIASASGSWNGRAVSSVGIMWSVVAKVLSGNATPMPRDRSMSNACGVVTS